MKMSGLPGFAEPAAIEGPVTGFEQVALAAIHVLVHRHLDRIVALAKSRREHLDRCRRVLRECIRECRVQFLGFPRFEVPLRGRGIERRHGRVEILRHGQPQEFGKALMVPVRFPPRQARFDRHAGESHQDTRDVNVVAARVMVPGRGPRNLKGWEPHQVELGERDPQPVLPLREKAGGQRECDVQEAVTSAQLVELEPQVMPTFRDERAADQFGAVAEDVVFDEFGIGMPLCKCAHGSALGPLPDRHRQLANFLGEVTRPRRRSGAKLIDSDAEPPETVGDVTRTNPACIERPERALAQIFRTGRSAGVLSLPVDEPQFNLTEAHLDDLLAPLSHRDVPRGSRARRRYRSRGSAHSPE